MFFIIVAMISLAAVVFILVGTKVRAAFRLDHQRLQFHVAWLFLRIMKREYRIGRDNNRAVVLYRQLKNEEQVVTTLTEILFKEKPPRGASLFALIKLAIKSRYERRKASPWLTVLERSRVVLRLYVGLGVGDAFATAMVCGLLITVGNAVCAANSSKRESYQLFVEPIFNGATFSLKGDCIIDITPANIILGYFIYKLKARGKKHASD